MEIRIYFRMLQRGWWLIVLTTLAALNASLVISYLATPLYLAEARFLVSPNIEQGTNARDLVNSLDTLDKRSIISTYAEVLASQRILEESGALLQIAPAALEDYSVQAVVAPDANILELSVEGPNPSDAARLANAIGQRAIDYVESVYQVYNLDFLDQAAPPLKPSSPQAARDATLAAALGLLLGAALAILREQLLIPIEALRRRTMIDNDSSAYTRRYFERCLEDEISTHQGGVVSVGLTQLDGLRDLIDTLPTQVAHRVLHHVTDTLRKELRGNDSVGRWGDITFAVLLPATPGAAATRTFQRIQRALSEPLALDDSGETVLLNPSVGVATSVGGQSAARVRHLAETALEQARQDRSQDGVFLIEGNQAPVA